MGLKYHTNLDNLNVKYQFDDDRWGKVSWKESDVHIVQGQQRTTSSNLIYA